MGDFLYHPDIALDKTKTESEYKFKKVEVRAGFKIKIKNVSYQATEKRETSGLVGFELYDPTDTEYKTVLGTTGVKDGKPAAPITLF